MEALYQYDHVAANTAYYKLANRGYRYGLAVIKRDLLQDLAIYVARRDHSSEALSMDPFRLALELVMPGPYPPLNVAMRRSLALKLLFAEKKEITPAELEVFLKKLPPVKVIKGELGLIAGGKVPIDGNASASARRGKPLRPKKRRPVPHRLAGSSSDRVRKAGMRKEKRLRAAASEE